MGAGRGEIRRIRVSATVKLGPDEPTINKRGDKEWRVDGALHRVDGPAIERPNGYRVWCADGGQHRADGPAVERPNGDKEWWVDGNRHRVDGPAVERANGGKEWWVCGEDLAEAEFNEITDRLRREQARAAAWAAASEEIATNPEYRDPFGIG